MSDKNAGTPRVYLARHGETEWSKNGRYSGTTELSLTDSGIAQVTGTAQVLIGQDKLIDPRRLAHVYVSPRKRALQTLGLLFEGKGDGLNHRNLTVESARITTTNELAEWGYGKYEGLVTKEIRGGRKERGLDRESEWDIWRDGCEDGETAQQVTERLDSLIKKIHDIQVPHMHDGKPAHVLLIAHGHILRAFTKRWLRMPMAAPLSMMMEPGGIGALSYAHTSIDEPSFLLGLGLPI